MVAIGAPCPATIHTVMGSSVLTKRSPTSMDFLLFLNTTSQSLRHRSGFVSKADLLSPNHGIIKAVKCRSRENLHYQYDNTLSKRPYGPKSTDGTAGLVLNRPVLFDDVLDLAALGGASFLLTALGRPALAGSALGNALFDAIPVDRIAATAPIIVAPIIVAALIVAPVIIAAFVTCASLGLARQAGKIVIIIAHDPH